VHVRIEYRERRSRLTTALRCFLVLPHLVAALCVGLIAYEAIRFADARDRVRHAAAEPAA